MFGGGLLFVAALSTSDDGGVNTLDRDFVVGMSASYVVLGAVITTLYNRSRRYGYRMSERCRRDGHR